MAMEIALMKGTLWATGMGMAVCVLLLIRTFFPDGDNLENENDETVYDYDTALHQNYEAVNIPDEYVRPLSLTETTKQEKQSVPMMPGRIVKLFGVDVARREMNSLILMIQTSGDLTFTRPKTGITSGAQYTKFKDSLISRGYAEPKGSKPRMGYRLTMDGYVWLREQFGYPPAIPTTSPLYGEFALDDDNDRLDDQSDGTDDRADDGLTRLDDQVDYQYDQADNVAYTGVMA